MQSIREIKTLLEQCPIEAIEEKCKEWEPDSRKGVQAAIVAARKRYTAYKKEQERLEGLLQYEREGYAAGYTLLAGVDEVGRGPLAGPVVAAAVILPKECKIEGVNDSKKLSAKKREDLYHTILEKAVAYGIGVVSSERIDEINILQATYEAMREALSQLHPIAEYILADAVTIPGIATPQKGIIQGDAKSLSIGAASIIAKVYRDHMMEEYDKQYPGYGFASNKGYGSAEHIDGIHKLGLTPIHRRSFVKNILSREAEHTTEKGIRSEALAAKQMKQLGYVILEQNYYAAGGEIDLIAKKDDVIVFTEVKYRATEAYGLPCEAVDAKKRRHIIRTAKAYIEETHLEGCAFRFDVAELLRENGQTYFRYTEDAFQEES